MRSWLLLPVLALPFIASLFLIDRRPDLALPRPRRMSESASLDEFLVGSKRAFLASTGHFTIVVGNEAGDLDSMAASIAYAYFLAQSTKEHIVVALQQTAHADLFLRPENLATLRNAGIDTDHLLCYDDLPAAAWKDPRFSYVLVDHNKLLDQFEVEQDPAANERRVTGIIDHHADEGHHLTADPRTIKVVGSCSSLVTLHFSSLLSPSPTSTVDYRIPTTLAELLIAAIFIDTSLKLVVQGGKSTIDDEAAYSLLVPRLPFVVALQQMNNTMANMSTPGLPAAPESELDKVYRIELQQKNEVLLAIKNDVMGMSGRDLLRRDYKEYVFDLPIDAGEGTPLSNSFRYGLATVPLSFADWITSTSRTTKGTNEWTPIQDAVVAWMQERNLNILGILTSFNLPPSKPGKRGKHVRQLFVAVIPLSYNPEALEKVFEKMEAVDNVIRLSKLEKAGGSETLLPSRTEAVMRVYQQGNEKATRKQVAPLLLEKLEEIFA